MIGLNYCKKVKGHENKMHYQIQGGMVELHYMETEPFTITSDIFHPESQYDEMEEWIGFWKMDKFLKDIQKIKYTFTFRSSKMRWQNLSMKDQRLLQTNGFAISTSILKKMYKEIGDGIWIFGEAFLRCFLTSFQYPSGSVY